MIENDPPNDPPPPPLLPVLMAVMCNNNVVIAAHYLWEQLQQHLSRMLPGCGQQFTHTVRFLNI